MAKPLIGWPRYTSEVTYSGGSWSASYPISNLSSLPLSRVARSSDLQISSTVIRGTLAQKRVVGLVVLCGHSISTPLGQYRIRAYSDQAWTNLTVDSGVLDAWPRLPERYYSWGTGNFWLRRYTQEQIRGYNWYLPYYFGQNRYIGSFRIDITDTDNSAGFLDVGMVDIARALIFEDGVSVGADYGFLSRSQMIEARGGSRYFERLNKPRRFNGVVSAVSRDEALVNFFELQRQQDINEPFFWWPDREDTTHTVRRSFLARHESLDLLSHAHANNYDSVPLNLTEVI